MQAARAFQAGEQPLQSRQRERDRVAIALATAPGDLVPEGAQGLEHPLRRNEIETGAKQGGVGLFGQCREVGVDQRVDPALRDFRVGVTEKRGEIV